MALMLLVLVGALNWGLVGSVNFNLVEWLAAFLPARNGAMLVTGVYLLVGISALFLVLDRNVYLPFLGEAVFPCASLEPRTPKDADRKVNVTVPANAKIIYWASDAQEGTTPPVEDPWKAYGTYSNYGVTVADENGNAELNVRNPVSYKVPSGKLLKEHVHYRYCIGNGMLSDVFTVNI